MQGHEFAQLVTQWFDGGPRQRRALATRVQRAVLEDPSRAELLPALADTPAELRREASSFRALGLRNAGQLEALLRFVKSLDAALAAPIVHSWGNTRDLSMLAPLAAWALSADHEDVRLAALYFFGHFLAKGGAVAPYAQALQALARDDRKSAFYKTKVSTDADRVLRAAGLVTKPPKAPKSVAAAVKLLAQDPASQRVALAWLTGALVGDAADVRAAWPLLCKALKSADVEVRRAASMLAVTAAEEGAKASLVSDGVDAALRTLRPETDAEVRANVERALTLLAR